MALKGCITKAGKALDADDKKYLRDQLHNSVASEEEILDLLEGIIRSEQRDIIKLIEAQGLTVERAETVISEDTLPARPKNQSPIGPDDAGLHGKVSEEKTDSAVEEENLNVGRLQAPESSAKPSTKETLPTLGFDTEQSPGLVSKPNGDVASTKSKAKEPGDGSPLLLTRESSEEALQKLSEASPIIKRFLSDKNKQLFLDAFTNSFMADVDVVNVQGPRAGNDLDLNTKEGLKRQVEILEHEIIHANTIGYVRKHVSEAVESPQLRDIKYLGKAVTALGSLDTNKLSAETARRVQYILSQSDLEIAVAEFIAIMGAESDVSTELYKVLGRRQGLDRQTLLQTIARLAKRVLKAITDGDLKKDIDIDLLNSALIRTIEQGTEFREQQYSEFRKYTQELDTFNYNSKASGVNFTRKASFDYLNYAVASMLNSRLERKGKKILGNLHEILLERFPMYVDASNKAIGVYDSSPALQQFVHTITGENVNKQKKADVLAKFAAINAQRTEIINSNISKIDTLSRDLKPQEKADLDVFISQMPLHDYFVLAGDLKTAESIEAEAELLRKKLWKVNARAVRDVDQLIDWHIDGDLTGTLYNLDASPAVLGSKNTEFVLDLRKLLALESIKRVGSKKFEKLLRHEELMDLIKDNSVANSIATEFNEGSENVRDSLIMDYWKEPFRIKAVKESDFRMYEFGEETGWKVLQAPTRTKLGIVYKPTIDSTDIAGAYTDTKLSSSDVDVTESMRKFPGVVQTRNGFKLLLTKEQKQELGLIEEFGQGLVRSAAHSISTQDSQVIRDELLQKDTYMVIGRGKSIAKIEGIIESDNIDNPWFLKLEEGTEYAKLPAAVRAKYMPVGNRASNVKNFNDNVDLVRKDISHWLLGGSASSLFQNPKLKWVTRILKNLISGAKIGMVVLNPVKIANDNLSNLTYLGVLGLSPAFIASNYKEISTDFADYSDIQRQIFQAKIQLVSRPESKKIKKHIKNLQKRLSANSIGDIGDKGFVNSLGSDLVSRSADTLSGFQADMHTSLEYLLTSKEGNKNFVSHFILQMQKIGYQAEDFFGYLGDLAGKAKSTKLLQQELDQVSDRLREIKSEEDIVNYVSQFTTSPSSEAVRFGSAMTDLTDVLAKETLYRHFVENQRMSAEDARIKVLDSFPDYKENMPLAVKQLSDAGIIMFPSFWLRIQKIIYRMARDKPINLATELMVQEALGSNVNTIFEANVINKSNTFGGLLHMPYEPIGIGSVVPTNIF